MTDLQEQAHDADGDSVDDVGEARAWRLGPSQQDVLVAIAAAGLVTLRLLES